GRMARMHGCGPNRARSRWTVRHGSSRTRWTRNPALWRQLRPMAAPEVMVDRPTRDTQRAVKTDQRRVHMLGWKTGWRAVGVLAVSVPLAACSSPAAAPTPSSPTAAPAAAGGQTPAAKPGGALSGKLTIAGSSALQPLVDQAAKNFQTTNKDVQITVS